MMMNIKLEAVFKSRQKMGKKARADMRSKVEKKAHNVLVRCLNQKRKDA